MGIIQSNIGTDITVKDGQMTIHRTQDCDPIAERMKHLHNTGQFGSSDMKFAGTIPDVMIEKYCNLQNITYSEFIQNKEHVRRIMADPAMDHFRVWKGKL